MNKDFFNWAKQKNKIHEDKIRAYFNEREVWFASLGANVGYEQDGRGKRYLRPIIVVKKFNNEVLWCIPLTKNNKIQRYYFALNINNNTSTAILTQLRLIDAKRLQYKIGNISEKAFSEIKEKIKQLFA
jgi:mRNA interferase MazF